MAKTEKKPEKTVEEKAQEFFDTEKVAYEKRTNTKVKYVRPVELDTLPADSQSGGEQADPNAETNAAS